MESQYVMSDKLKRASSYSIAEADARTFLECYELAGPVIFLPDLTPSSSLPIGSVARIYQGQKINPNLIGVDIGCGFQFVNLPINGKRLYKKNKPNKNRVEALVRDVSESLEQKDKQDPYLGTIGGGNHFIGLFAVDKLIDSDVAEQHKISADDVYALIHSGSRVQGFETQRSYAREFSLSGSETIEDFNSRYLRDFRKMKAYAKTNRDELRKRVEEAVLDGTNRETEVLFDSVHNDIVEENGVYVLRKGAAQLSFGQLGIIPSNCCDFSYLVVGDKGLSKTGNSINHGCGRKYTRSQVFQKFRRKKDLDSIFNGVILNVRPSQMIEEVPAGYKNIDDVINSVEEQRLARRVAKLKPLAMIVERKEEKRK
jgi:release factor H-coupled RctB family protein